MVRGATDNRLHPGMFGSGAPTSGMDPFGGGHSAPSAHEADWLTVRPAERHVEVRRHNCAACNVRRVTQPLSPVAYDPGGSGSLTLCFSDGHSTPLHATPLHSAPLHPIPPLPLGHQPTGDGLSQCGMRHQRVR